MKSFPCSAKIASYMRFKRSCGIISPIFAEHGKDFMDNHREFEQANRRGQEMLAAIPHAVSARYDRRIARIVVRLSTGLEISFSPCDAQGLETATWEQLQEIEIDHP